MEHECTNPVTGVRRHNAYTPADYDVTRKGCTTAHKMCRQCLLGMVNAPFWETVTKVAVLRRVTNEYDNKRHQLIMRRVSATLV